MNSVRTYESNGQTEARPINPACESRSWQDLATLAFGDLISQAEQLPSRVVVKSLTVNLVETPASKHSRRTGHAFGTLKATIRLTSHRDTEVE